MFMNKAQKYMRYPPDEVESHININQQEKV